MRDLTDELKALRARLDEAAQYLKVDELRARQPQLEAEASRPDLWDDPDKARRVTSELVAVNDDLAAFEALSGRLDDAETLYELARDEADEASLAEVEQSLKAIDADLRRVELRSMFSGEHDERDALVTIQAGEGGVDAQDWAEMLLRMITRWAERRGFDVEVEEFTPGTEAGISSAELIVKGRYAYGYLQAERGVHRLVRISPFNSQGKRQTAFAALQVVPMLDDGDSAVEIDEKDIKMDVFRASGAGGQHVNKTSSAVRLTHIPTGIVVSCQVERSQFQNRDRAISMLRAKLADLERQRREAELDEIRGDQQRVGFGSQIRSYVLQPYQMVKDLRSEHETGNVAGVLDGDLDPFMEAYLQWRRSAAGGTPVGAA
ncbi:MAG TPA: peptide chain release factor 2 [Acidimicrobiales bacterium]|jgi:peptide chain release factor 2|nr:peptide chain release factor 2 [Acidimicrobiales bacterium]